MFATWLGPACLELHQITWNDPACLLEKIVTYEAVHPISNLYDLKRRLGTGRRCFGFFHPAMPGEPLVFIEVALTNNTENSIQKVLFDEAICEENQATTALLYSISSTQVLFYMHFSSNGSFVLDNSVSLTCCLEVAHLLFIFLVCLGFDSGPPAYTRHLED
jgi:hypothetical protein